MKRLFYTSILLTVLFTGFIFSNSMQSKSESLQTSAFLTDVFRSVIDWFFDDVGGIDVSLLVRKIAHFVEFAVLGSAVGMLLVSLKKLWNRTFYGFGLFYLISVAVSDEFIQKFFDRGSSVSDIVLDFSGAVFGVVFVLLIKTTYICFRKRKITLDENSIK